MSNQKIGVAIFAGLLIVTGIISSGRFFDANALLDQFMDRAADEDEIASLPAAVKESPVEPAEEEGAQKAAVSDEANEQAKSANNETSEVSENSNEESLSKESANTSVDNSEQTVEEVTAPQEEVVAQGDTRPAEDDGETASAAPKTSVEKNEEVADSDTSTEVQTEVDREGDGTEAAIAAEAKLQPDPPVFDLLRVEPNGDMVVAGVTSPGAEMELVAGSKTLTKTTANANGEFVAILDEALDPGDYEIVLRSTDSDGLVMTSTETAIVSIPEAGSDEVIALVEAPGVPSRLITVPEVESAAAQEDATKAAGSNAEAVSARAESGQSEEGAQEVEVAKVEPKAEPVTPTTSAKKPIRIEAVEIDGPTVFVAGAAEPGTNLRIYANEILLGDTQASAQGRFLIEVNKDLPVGDYIIRADALSSNGAEVVMRAAVPFTRSAGEKLAAVAVPPTTRLPSEPPKIEQSADDEQAQEDTPSSAVESSAAVAVAGATTNQESANTEGESTEIAATTPTVESSAQIEGDGTLEQPLTPVENSVVIRRGDTLWHISKRVYGQGIKYTTIYKANDDQIRDPDMIWPGQVFALPEEG